MSLCKWNAQQIITGIIRRQTLMRATNDRKLQKAMISQVPKVINKVIYNTTIDVIVFSFGH